MSDISELQRIVVKFRDDRDWKQFHNAKDMAISLSLEASELLEHFQWKSLDEVNAYLSKHKNDVADELADVLYWVLLMANDLEINLSEQLNKKVIKNNDKYPIQKSKGNHKKYTEL